MSKNKRIEKVPIAFQADDKSIYVKLVEGEVIQFAGRDMAITPKYNPYRQEFEDDRFVLTDIKTGCTMSHIPTYSSVGGLKRGIKSREAFTAEKIEEWHDMIAEQEKKVKNALIRMEVMGISLPRDGDENN